MFKVLDPPPLDQDAATTFWLGDPAVDQDASDVARYAETGEADALVVRPGQTPTAIRWRPLDEWELTTLPDVATTSLELVCVDAAAMGLVSIEGYKLHRLFPRGSVAGVIPMDELRALRGLRTTFQVGLTFDRYYARRYGRESNPTMREQVGEISLPVWFGALILAHSFPGG